MNEKREVKIAQMVGCSDILLCMKDLMVTVRIEVEGSPAIAKEILTKMQVGAKFMLEAGNEFDSGLIRALKLLRDHHE